MFAFLPDFIKNVLLEFIIGFSAALACVCLQFIIGFSAALASLIHSTIESSRLCTSIDPAEEDAHCSIKSVDYFEFEYFNCIEGTDEVISCVLLGDKTLMALLLFSFQFRVL